VDFLVVVEEEGEEVVAVQANQKLLLRISLAVTFIWFGILKLIEVSPVLVIIEKAMPNFMLQIPYFLTLLSLLEIAIGIGLFVPTLVRFASIVMIAHLTIATLSVLVTQGFNPSFPFLTVEGEFVVKNIVFIAIAWILVTDHTKQDPIN
jgi:uncharacterized membrane protein YphA (DoxX/SURF4 family)